MKRLKIKEIAQVTDCKSAPAGKYANSGNEIVKEEYLNYTRNYKRQGLYPEHGFDLEQNINIYGTAAGVNPLIINRYCFEQPWYHFIYKIPRR